MPTRALPFLLAVLMCGCAVQPRMEFALLPDGGEAPQGARDRRRAPSPPPPDPPADLKAPTRAEIDAAIDAGLRGVLAMEEGAEGVRGEWPYQGVYRVGGKIPIGYRVGGTAICCMALTHHPAYEDPEAGADFRAAVRRGVAFIASATDHALMSHAAYDGGYDVRAWGYIYALWLLVDLEQRGLTPEPLAGPAAEATSFYLSGLEALEIPGAGGWAYARPPGRANPGKPSPFMTGAALQALFAAADAGEPVDRGVIERGLSALERTLYASGEAAYSGDAAGRDGAGGWPGAIGRTATARTTLFLAGRSTAADVRTTLDRFLEHWKWLEARRQQSGTHVRPYGVAPYYFFFAHHAAAQAVACLPEAERQTYRDRLNALLFHVRDDDATWNDRVFPRSANFGTSMACMALVMDRIGLPAAWPAVDRETVGD